MINPSFNPSNITHPSGNWGWGDRILANPLPEGHKYCERGGPMALHLLDGWVECSPEGFFGAIAYAEPDFSFTEEEKDAFRPVEFIE